MNAKWDFSTRNGQIFPLNSVKQSWDVEKKKLASSLCSENFQKSRQGKSCSTHNANQIKSF